jgi:hypothetical protein
MTEEKQTLDIVSTHAEDKKENLFDFIKDPNKLNLLIKTNETLNLNKANHNKIIFIYSAPKVGSTSIVSSLRIFGSEKFIIIHIHDEEMLKVLGHINGITINEIILFNKYLGKDVYVIDIYRSPIERKISVFFEKIGSYHFNNNDELVNEYNILKVINRFNNIFEHIGNGDHFIDKYNITIPEKFDYKNKFTLIKENGINYIKLRLKDSNSWGPILTNIFQTRICIVKDYESTNKPIKKLYNLFKSQYKIPMNYLTNIMSCKYLNYYYSDEEKGIYFNEWSRKSGATFLGYSVSQFKMYEELTMENCHIDNIQLDHYLDEGCLCKACVLKRAEVASQIMRGLPYSNRIVHTEAKTEFIQKRVTQVNKINRVLQNIPKPPSRNGSKPNFKTLIKNK